MRPTDDVRRLIDKAAVSTNPCTDKVVLDTVLAAQEKAIDNASPAAGPSVGRIIMSNRITRIATAAAAVIVTLLIIGLWDRSTPSAYAFEQTLEANRGIRYLHIRNFTAGRDEPREGWIEFDENGQASRLRAHMPEWASPVEGPRVFVWKDGTVQIWLKKQNRLAITRADSVQEQLRTTLKELDPRQALAHLAEFKDQGKVETVIEESPDKTGPIIMTVTYLPASESPGRRKVLSIDPATKLISTIELYQLTDGEYRHEGRIELREYNQPIDPKMFDLTNDVPADAERLDFSATELGLAQGLLSDEEVAVRVVRQFFESLMAGDYDTAGRLIPLGPAALKEHFGSVKILRVVSVGPATPVPGPGNTVLTVACTIECEDSGERDSVTLDAIEVQQLPAQPDRWVIRTLGN